MREMLLNLKNDNVLSNICKIELLNEWAKKLDNKIMNTTCHSSQLLQATKLKGQIINLKNELTIQGGLE